MIAHSKEKLDELYANLLIDPNFEKLELLRNQPNIFEILGVSHFEIRHSHFLAWLFNPKGNHGIGDYFLKRFLLDVLQDSRSYLNVLQIHQLLQEEIIIHREKHNIDVLIEFENTLIVVENKIHASEGNDQLKRYSDTVLKQYPDKKPIFVYLTKYGTEASLNNIYIEISYQNQILEYLNDLIQYRSESIQEHVLIYIKDYIHNQNKNIMKQSEANVIAEKIYRQHQELFDFIISNKPNSMAIIKEKLIQSLLNDNFVLGSDYVNFIRFLPNDINLIIPKEVQPKKRDWKNGEAFLIEFILNQDKNILVYQIAISSYVINHKEYIKELFLNIGLNLTQEVDNTWFVFERKEYEVDFSRFDEDNYIKAIYDNIMAEQKPKIEKLSKVIIENQAILKTN